MTIYKNNPARSLKWLVALIVFLLAMGVTWSDVYGYQTSKSHDHGKWSYGSDDKTADSPRSFSDDYSDDVTCGNDEPPAAIPEPATLILLGSGLGTMYMVRRRRNRAAKR